MKMLIVIEHSPKQRFLVNLHTEKLVKEVKGLVDRKRHSQAIVTALAKGLFEKEVLGDDLSRVKVGLILTEENASWDLAK